jgi:DNA (cytosine-5)-methyltransferase 1
MKKLIKAVDLFCGAGGTSTGLIEACEQSGARVHLTGINHWDVAIATHQQNHPHHRTFCTGIDAVNPRALFKEGEVDVLWASPECTHHSIARGGKPINDQSRATAFCVLRWAEALHPDIILVENVREFLTWGPLIRKRVAIKGSVRTHLAWVPDPKRKGQIFQSWFAQLAALGYRADFRVLCAADYGDPTTRERLFIQAVRLGSRLKITWPNPTHAAKPDRADLLSPDLKPWVPARAIVDWSVKGRSIYGRKKCLAANTLRRSFIGLVKFGLAPVIVRAGREGAALVKLRGTGGALSLAAPLPAVTAGGTHLGLVEPHLTNVAGISTPHSALRTPHSMGVGEPCLIEVNHGKNSDDDSHRVRSVEEPLKPVTTKNGTALCNFLMTTDHTGGGGDCVRSLDQPLTSVVTKANAALVEPKLTEAAFLLGQHSCSAPRGLDQPTPTVMADGAIALVDPKLEPFIIPANFGARPGQEARGHSVDEPLRTVVGSNVHALVEPFLLPREGVHRGNAPRSVDQPLPTVTTNGAGHLAEPQLTPVTRRRKSTLSTKSTVESPAVNPYLIKFYATATAQSVAEPLDTVTTKQRFGLAVPLLEPCAILPLGALVIHAPLKEALPLVEKCVAAVRAGRRIVLEMAARPSGERRFYLLDILFRMLNWRELAGAQGFRPDYNFTGNSGEIVKQIGNAVPRRLARAIAAAVITQNPDVQ